MPNVLPNIPQEPAQGIQALLDTVYLWNPDVANELIDKVNELLEELGDLTNLGAIKPYAELVAPVPQYLPMSYNNAVYVANEVLEVLPETPDLTKWTQIATKVDQGAIETQIQAEENARVAEDAILQGNIDSEASARAQADTALDNRITAEETARSGADSNLQTQIDAISASSDVKDIVGTHAELEDYDTSTLGDNDIIKVLQDETEEGATTYYRWVAADQEFSLIGEEGPYYTKAQADTLLGQKQNTLTAGEGITIENDVISATASGDFVPQLDVLPTADASNAGEIAQYSGETIPDVPASAVATQTVGSGLSDLAVNVDKFVEAEQPTQGGNTSFVADVVPDTSVVVEATMRPEDYSFDSNAFIAMVKATWTSEESQDQFGFGTKYLVFDGAEQGGQSWGLCLGADGSGQVAFVGDNPSSWGLTVINQPSSYQYIMLNTTRGSVAWSKNGTTVNLASYGITYSGTPADGDTISVAYTPLVAGITNGYFYKSSVEYSDPVATISQTVGSGLGDLAVNVDTFVEVEQPTQSGNTSFVAATGWGLAETYFNSFGENMTVDSSLFMSALQNAFPGLNLSSVTSIAIGITAQEDYPGYQRISVNVEVDHVPDSFITWVNDKTVWGIACDAYPAFETYWWESTTIVFGATWSKNDTAVDLADYGISYSGTPADGDTLTVAYTAPVITGYAWNQVNVQPSSGGGSAGIEWKTKVDLPAEYTGSVWDARPYYTVVGGLPDGTYEFYFATKVKRDLSFPVGEVIYKVRFTKNSQNNTARGIMGYVFDGDYMNNDSKVYGGEARWWYNWLRDNGSDLIIYGDLLGSDILNYNEHQAVPECFKLSAIKNVDTGQEYIADGAINLDGSEPAYTALYDSNMVLAALTNPPYVPQAATWTAWATAEFATKTVYINRRIMGGSLHLITDGSELIINFTGVGSNEISPYSQEIVRATGIFAGCYLAYGASYIYVMGVDTTTAATLSGTVRCACGGSSTEGVSMWFDTIPTEPLTTLAQFGPQAYCLGTITYDGLGNIVQYTGATDSNYTNGYFYKATGTAVTTPASITFTNVVPSDVTVAVADPDALVTALNSVGGWGEEWVRNRLTLEYSEFNIGYNSDTGTIVRVWWSNYGDIYTQDVLDCFAVSTTGSYTGEVSIAFACNRGYVPESKGVQNTAWVQVEVQPNSGGLPDQTGNAGKFLTTDGTDASWSDKPLVNNTTIANSIAIGNSSTGYYGNTVAVGYSAKVSSNHCIAIGGNTQARGADGSIAIGSGAVASSGIAIGQYAQTSGVGAIVIANCGSTYSPTSATAMGAIQLGSRRTNGQSVTNSDADTFKVANINGNFEIMSADGTIPADRLTHAINKYSTMPTAASTNEGWIVQYTGTTDSTYTHGHLYECVSDGADPATYSWEEVSLGGATYTAGTGIDITNDVISTKAPVIANVSPNATSMILKTGYSSGWSDDGGGNTIIGKYAIAASSAVSGATLVGTGLDWDAAGCGFNSVAVGYRASAGGSNSSTQSFGIAVGAFARATANHSTQIGSTGAATVNSDANTFKVANANGNFEIMSADGTIPEARLADTTNAAQGQVLTLDSNLNAVWQASGGGNYLPLTGGTITGPLVLYRNDSTGHTLANPAIFDTSTGSSVGFSIGSVYNGSFTPIWSFTNVAITYSGSSFPTLGTSASPFSGVYAQTAHVLRLNNGGMINVPQNTTGTMAVISVNTTVTLAVADWSSNTQTVSVTGMTADGVVMVSPTPANQSAYTDAGILCTAQAAGSLTFTCDTVPSADITVTVVML